jgi:hypothetical protein
MVLIAFQALVFGRALWLQVLRVANHLDRGDG